MAIVDEGGSLSPSLEGEQMRRPLFIALVLLIGGALSVPTAQASRPDPQHTRYRFFQDLSITSPLPGRILFGVLFKQNSHGEFTPRVAVGYSLQTGVSCNPGGDSVFRIGGNAFSKYAYFSATLRKGRFYSTAKGAIRGFTTTLARDLAPEIRVNALAPGPISGEWETEWGVSPEHIGEAIAMNPLKHFGKPEEIAETVLFLASDGAGYITGQVIHVDGGWVVAG